MSQTSTSPETAPNSDDAQEPRRLLLIDGHSMAFRAFYALPVESFTTSNGQATNAVHGFTSMFLSLLDSESPTHVAVAFDLPGGTFRTEEYPEYKGTRDETPEPFVGQVELIQDVLEAMGVRTVTASGYEADDVLATLARSAQAEGMEVLLCSGDRDTFQLVTDGCTVLYPVKGVSTLRRMTPAEVEARYGVTPERYPHLAALVGESSDNLPGVPGVGPKTAAKWIAQYDGLDGVLASAPSIKGKAGENLRAHLEEVRRNRRLNALVSDLDLGIDPAADLASGGADRQRLQEVFERLEFRTLAERAGRVLSFTDLADHAQDAGADEDLGAQLAALTVTVLGAGTAAGSLRGWLQERLGWQGPGSGPRLLGLETLGPAHPGAADTTLLALSDGSQALVLDPSDLSPQDDAALAELLAAPTPEKVVTDAKAAWHRLRGRGWDLDLSGFDPALAGYLCRPEQRKYDVVTLAQRWLGVDLESLEAQGGTAQAGQQAAFDLDSLEEAVSGEQLACARRAAVQSALRQALRQEMDRRAAQDLFPLETQVAAVLVQMEDAGIAVDEQVLALRETELDARVNHAQEEAFKAAGHELNLSSPKQLQTVLFEELQMPRTRRTKTGYTTDAGALTALFARTGHPFLEHLLEHRDAIKLRQTVEGLRKAVLPDGRVHTTFQQTVAATGRLSSTDPNLQNIPARTEEGMRIREAFTTGAGYECLMTADYSQIEMRIMAHLSGDEALIGAFNSGEDLHRYVAALVHEIDVEHVTAEQRSHIKAMSYGLVYGLSAYGLSKQLGISTAEATSLQERYFERFGRVKGYLDAVVEQARADGFTQTMLGRRRYLPELGSDNRQLRETAERAALNAPVQGSAADIMKVAMVRVRDALRQAAPGSRLLLQIHDELMVEVAPGEAAAVETVLREQMGGAVQLSVPLEVSVGRGHSWREAAH
ncbi:DNA polymerase I [Actinomyces weissii]|uniref:DNA polymerase I n=1 Tax=Actinomyces weissii TaxID=675090 RepID=A0A7T7M805_9ACTO|nr:DNA polymerase I [Actinomyces weissii]QQM66592.1 DNA polymerase I [Actinomyces weissii]